MGGKEKETPICACASHLSLSSPIRNLMNRRLITPIKFGASFGRVCACKDSDKGDWARGREWERERDSATVFPNDSKLPFTLYGFIRDTNKMIGRKVQIMTVFDKAELNDVVSLTKDNSGISPSRAFYGTLQLAPAFPSLVADRQIGRCGEQRRRNMRRPISSVSSMSARGRARRSERTCE